MNLDMKYRSVVLASFFGMHSVGLSAFAAPADNQRILDADNSFRQAINKSDGAAVAALLDENFEWTNAEGRTRTKQESLQNPADLKDDGKAATNTKAYNYGEAGFISGSQDEKRFLRVWVMRPAGWRLFNYIETHMMAKAPLPSGGGDCDNPCKSLPYTPTTEMDKLIIDAWQKAKNDEWHPNSSDWALRVADEFVIINEHTSRTKAERIALLAKQQENGDAGAPGDPVQSIRMFDFGRDAAVMLSQHSPYHGGKPYYNVRVWILRNRLWQIAVSQQTTIELGAPAPAVAT